VGEGFTAADMKLVCTYSDGKAGVGQELARYLAERRETFLLLEHPMWAGRGWRSRLTRYERGVSDGGVEVGKPRGSLLAQYAACTLLTFSTVWRHRLELDVFVGHSNIDCLAAMAARRRRGCRVVYCSIDYVPQRFASRLLNGIFRVADRLAYRGADAVWHSYPDAARWKPFARRGNCHETLHGNNFRRIARRPWEQRKPHGLAYLGGVIPAAHIEEAVACVGALRRLFSDTTLDVIGDSPDPAYLERLRTSAGALAGKAVAWHGLIGDSERFEPLLCGLGVALCLYEMTPERASYYQLPGKVFAYAACGLPTIVLDSSGPVCVREIEKNGIGVVTALSDLEKCIGSLFADEKRHRELAENAVRWASRFDWKDKFDKYLGMLQPPGAGERRA
jgi:glycosyltransferase involved in cell wall biosynthesis